MLTAQKLWGRMCLYCKSWHYGKCYHDKLDDVGQAFFASCPLVAEARGRKAGEERA